MKNMSLDIGAGLILGVPGDDLMNVLGRISKKDAAALVTDKFIPFTISENIQQVFKENADKLGISDPYKEAERAIESLADVMSEIDLTDSEWPDLTELFRMDEADVPSTQPGALNTPAIDPKIYQRPTLTLGQGVNTAGMSGNFGTPQNTGLTANQLALLSPSEQQYYMRRNQNRV